MDQSRGILFLSDPLRRKAGQPKQAEYTHSMTLIFDENGRYLSHAQAALWRMRKRYEWICVAAEGEAVCIAIALAAQLPVERLALTRSSLFVPGKHALNRELVQLRSYARRNLALVISEILLIGPDSREVRGLLRGRSKGKLCVLDEREEDMKNYQNILVGSWEQACQNNLLIPWKCV